MSEWKEYKLGEVYEFASGLSKRADQFGYGYIFLSFKDVFQNFFIPKKLSSLVNSSEKERNVCSIKRGDIFLTRTSETQEELGMSSVALTDYPNATFNGFTKRLRPKGNIEIVPEFAGYYFRSPKFRANVTSMSSITTRASLNNNMLNALKIVVPPTNIQQSIGSILKSLDDKIDLLRRQNVTLEKMAETLFRQWFVEEAKEEWKMGKIFDYALHFKDSIHPQKNKTILYYHYSIPAFDNEKNPICELGKEIQSNKYKVPANCILFSKLNPHKDKRIWLLQNEVDPHAICSTEFQVILPRRKEHLYFLYGWLSLRDNYNEIASGVGGTSGSHQRINPNTIYDFQCPLATESVIKNFNTKTEPLFQKQLVNQAQIRTLTALRDTLLPQLMSGEVQVKV